MLKHISNEPVPTYISTFRHIATELIPIDKQLKEMITVFNLQFYGQQNYRNQTNPGLLALVDQFAPAGLTSTQTDLFYLFRAFVNVPELTPQQRKQWDQYIKDGCELINLIISYPNPNWEYLLEHLSTNRINIPVAKFFALSTSTEKVEPLSKRTFSLFIGCYNRFINLLWVILYRKL
jgi:hypothetical protein